MLLPDAKRLRKGSSNLIVVEESCCRSQLFTAYSREISNAYNSYSIERQVVLSLALCQTHPGNILLKTFFEDDINGNSFFPIVVNEKKGTGTIVIVLGAESKTVRNNSSGRKISTICECVYCVQRNYHRYSHIRRDSWLLSETTFSQWSPGVWIKINITSLLLITAEYWKGGRQNIGEGDTDIGKEDEEYYTWGQQNIGTEDDKILDRRKSENYEGGNSIKDSSILEEGLQIIGQEDSRIFE